MSIPRVLEHFTEPWAMQPEKLELLLGVVLRHDAGVRLSAEEIRAAVGARETAAAGPVTQGLIGILPLQGSIFPRANMITDSSGGTSLQRFMSQFRAMMAEPNVKAILIDVDSPGGAVAGVTEAANEIMAARGQKLIVAQSNHMAGSAAYMIAAAADEVVASPSSLLGSIGVFVSHLDRSKANELAGEKVSYITSVEGKVDGNENEPLSDEARAKLQRRVDEQYAVLAKDVARGRSVPVSTVRSTWKADVYTAAEAVRLGLADRVATIEETLRRLGSGAGRRASMRADGVAERLAAGEVWDAELEAWSPAPPAAAIAEDDGEAERRIRRAAATGL